MNIRIIPRLDIKGPNLVKGIHLEGLRVLGKPWDFALKYYMSGADELIYIDSVASLYGRNNLLDIVEQTADKIFIPLTVGGGIRSVEDIARLLRSGADKVAINTAAIKDPDLISKGAEAFGSQCIVISIEAKKTKNGYMAFTDNGREPTGKNAVEWAKEAVERGAGEILLTSIDKEGTGKGYDLDLCAEIAGLIPVPVILCGGCGRPEHLLDAVVKGRADAVSAASIFHYNCLDSLLDNINYRSEGNTEFISMKRGSLEFRKESMVTCDILKIKRYLTESGIICRN